MAEHFSFEVRGKVKGKQRPFFTHGRAITPKETVNYENLVRLSFINAGGEHFGDVPLRVSIICHFPIPSSWSNRKKAMFLNAYCPKKPDIDNIVKSILDGLNGTAWNDDKQVVSVEAVKVYGDTDKAVVSIRSLE